ncbi:MAG: hypothetical protein VR66_20235 [Peptococcaceae bacterium BRH_c23]|nr:MAG: hypothetical protein VR66_20235 [Peptococcaceae bacterium BRH_c23]
MNNQEVIEQTLQNYDNANDALLAEWDQLDLSLLDIILQKQQNRLEQLAERIYHEELKEDTESEIIQNTIAHYEWANRLVYWNNRIRKQMGLLEEIKPITYKKMIKNWSTN